MTIHLSKDLETSILALVQGGRFSSVDDAMAEAARLLLKQSPPGNAKPDRKAKRAKPVPQAKAPLTRAEFDQLLLATGLVTQLPDPAQDIDDDDEPPIVIEGEPLSETIIRERR